MNGIDILWALLTLLSVILFISGDWLAQRKIRLLNYVLLVTGLFISPRFSRPCRISAKWATCFGC